MSNTRDTIMETLAQAGITNMSVDDVIAGFHHKILQRTRLFHAGVGLGDKAAN